MTLNVRVFAPAALIAAVLISLACALSSPGLRSGLDDEAESLAGSYDVSGANPDGSAYTGIAEITVSGGQIAVHWEIGSQTFDGTGQWDGETLTVVYDGGTAVYERRAGGTLEGSWSPAGEVGAGTEVLTRR